MIKFLSCKVRTLTLLLLMVWTLPMSAQNSNDAREVTDVYYIKNAFVIQKPGLTLPQTSILVKDGLIQNVGSNVSIPFDAKVIDADSMYVYAAFIDACTHAGIKKEEVKDLPSVSNPGNPPKNLAGITPQKTVRAAMSQKVEKSISDLREIGFGYAHVVPQGRMLTGMGSILTTSGKKPELTILQENASSFAQFKPARRMFPSTTIGVMSQFRDLMINAKNAKKYSSLYDQNPTGLERPFHSEELKALFPVVNNAMPIFFYTPKVKDLNRAMILHKELGFKLVLSGVRQAWPLLSEIKANNLPIVLSLHLPKKIEDEKPEAESKDKKEDNTGDDNTVNSDKKEENVEEVDEEMKALKARKKKSHDEHVGQAALLAQQGIKFSFSSLDTKSKDIIPNLRRMVAAGLSSQKALEALTTVPAQLLGISSMAGTVEKGKIANLFIADKPYFEEKSKIKFIINDGVLKEYKEDKKKKKGKSSGDSQVNLDGLWSYEVEVPGDTPSGTMKVEKEGDDFKISLDSTQEPGDYDEAVDVVFEDNNLTFTISSDGITYKVDIDFEGENFEGTVDVGEFGSFPMKGSKKETPKR